MKRKLVPIISLLLGIPAAFAADYGVFQPLVDILPEVFRFLSLDWLPGATEKGYAVKALYFIILITLLNQYLGKVIKAKKARGVISFAIAAISIIFMPENVSNMAGTQYGAVAGLLLMGFLPGLFIWNVFKWSTKKESPARERWMSGMYFFALITFSSIGTFVGIGTVKSHEGFGVTQVYSLFIAFLGIAALVYFFLSWGAGKGKKMAPGWTGPFSRNTGAGLRDPGTSTHPSRTLKDDVKLINRTTKRLRNTKNKLIKDTKDVLDQIRLTVGPMIPIAASPDPNQVGQIKKAEDKLEQLAARLAKDFEALKQDVTREIQTLLRIASLLSNNRELAEKARMSKQILEVMQNDVSLAIDQIKSLSKSGAADLPARLNAIITEDQKIVQSLTAIAELANRITDDETAATTALEAQAEVADAEETVVKDIKKDQAEMVRELDKTRAEFEHEEGALKAPTDNLIKLIKEVNDLETNKELTLAEKQELLKKVKDELTKIQNHHHTKSAAELADTGKYDHHIRSATALINKLQAFSPGPADVAKINGWVAELTEYRNQLTELKTFVGTAGNEYQNEGVKIKQIEDIINQILTLGDNEQFQRLRDLIDSGHVLLKLRANIKNKLNEFTAIKDKITNLKNNPEVQAITT